MSEKVDENDNNTERQAVEREINDLVTEINSIKKVMFNLYQKNRYSSAFKDFDQKHTICAPNRFKSKRVINSNDEMGIRFHKKFLKAFIRSKLDTVRFSFPRHDKEQYGLQFRCRAVDKYFMEKCFLPHTFNMQDQKDKTYTVTFKEIPEYVQIVMENINAYSLRELQIDEFKKNADKRVLVSHSTCYTDVDLNFKILTLDSNVRKCVNVNLFYPLLNILPSTIEVTVEGDILLKRYLEAIFAVFKEDTLLKAYQQAFVNSDQLKFFI